MDYGPQKITKALITKLAKADPPDKPKEIRDTSSAQSKRLILRIQPSGYMALYVEVGRGKRERVCNARRIADERDPLTLDQAKEKADTLRGDSAGGKDFKSEREVQAAIPTLQHFLEHEYRDWAGNNKLRTGEQNIQRVKNRFPKLLKLKLDQITPAKVERWKATRRDVEPETVNRDLGTLSSVLGKAVKLKMIPENPLAGVDMLRVDRSKEKVRSLTADEKQRLIKALIERDDERRKARANANEWRSERDYELMPSIGTFSDVLTPATITALETGMRFGEQMSLIWGHVDLKARTVFIKGETTKSYQTRTIPLTETAYRTLRDWWLQEGQPKRGPVFHIDGKPVGSLKKSYGGVLARAEIERENERGQRVTWHSLRHTFGSLLGAAGVDVVRIQKLMGHADIKTTMRYLHTDEQSLREAIDQSEALASSSHMF